MFNWIVLAFIERATIQWEGGIEGWGRLALDSIKVLDFISL